MSWPSRVETLEMLQRIDESPLRVVTWDHLIRDILGTLGWRPDLLTRLEARRPSQGSRDQ
ncbi:MAG TPA: hypothetical protein VE075_01765 [Thermoanaerobaculia bacterium]|nr:hypothetical protein [Thermoanaerobaculia bacterium]